MRLKTFHADTLAEAMELVRQTLGPNAIIVATHEDEANRGARVTAAVDPAEQDFDFFSEGASEQTLEFLTQVLEQHRVPNLLIDRLVNAAAEGSDSTPCDVLAGALDTVFDFTDLPRKAGGPPIMFIGPPGVGKTVSCAKLAAQVTLSDDKDVPTPVNLIAADPVRVGAVAQLQAYADKLDATLYETPDAAALSSLLTKLRRTEMAIIDTPGSNPYEMNDLAHLVELSEAGQTETVLVLSAGRDAEEAAELAEAFRPVGATRLVMTGLDVARRLGSLLAAADAGGLSIANVSLAPEIGHGLTPLDSMGLAKLLLPDDKAQGGSDRDGGVSAS